MDEVRRLIEEALSKANELNAEGRATRSRFLSLTITKLEEATMWLDRSREPASSTRFGER